MSPEVELVCYLLGLICFAVVAVSERHLGWAGLFAITLVPFWDALEATR